jgi:hypothetical protein
MQEPKSQIFKLESWEDFDVEVITNLMLYLSIALRKQENPAILSKLIRLLVKVWDIAERNC